MYSSLMFSFCPDTNAKYHDVKHTQNNQCHHHGYMQIKIMRTKSTVSVSNKCCRLDDFRQYTSLYCGRNQQYQAGCYPEFTETNILHGFLRVIFVNHRHLTDE